MLGANLGSFLYGDVSVMVNGSLAILQEPLVNCLINRGQPEKDFIIEEYKCRLLYNLRARGLDALTCTGSGYCDSEKKTK